MEKKRGACSFEEREKRREGNGKEASNPSSTEKRKVPEKIKIKLIYFYLCCFVI